MKQVDGDAAWMCDAQIVQRDDFASFSTLGIVLVFLLGAFLLFLDACLDQLIDAWYTRVHPARSWKLQAWRASRNIQVQSQAFEAQGLGTWDRTKIVPVTENDVEFVNPFCTALPDEHSKLQKETGRIHWWQLGGHEEVNTSYDPGLSHGIPTMPGETSSPAEKSSFRPFEMELGHMSKSNSYHSRPTYQRIDTDNDGVIR